MSRYIDAYEVKRQIQMATEGEVDVMKVFLKAMYSIDKIPTADVVEVVRCKNCKYWQELLPVCERIHRAGWGVNDYCSYGEREDK